ncbi:type II toxin-antitoxin system RelE/ParE family toxin [Sphingobium yanoikuyae]|uniref:type II toxin-antitoxin system RelE/ParE family toxin n=1 Tax=Sphingobium yanoikuyae TaxID=13690 RepID=UPI0022DD5407|nr:type II toxin-antitoxin system RelE/ParE family toxin [Sphingobium yanoikuyae]WBQ17716.1 type II toxin-antitoxin system RelE/ParE family toxin [Sphingobium yanoikuyae]
MRLEFSPAAETDLTEIASFIARDNVPRAISFVDELQSACEALLDFPQSGTARHDIREGLRSRPHGSYVIFYEVQPTTVRIQRILHGARDIGGILSVS